MCEAAEEKKQNYFSDSFSILALVTLGASLLYDILVNEHGKAKKLWSRKNAEDTVVLELAYAYQNSQWNSAIESIVQAFEKEYPDIEINYDINYEDNVYEDNLSKRIARDELGDIVQLKNAGGLCCRRASGGDFR